MLGSIFRQGGQEFKPGVAVREGLSTTWQHSGLKNFDWQSGGAATISGTKQFDAFGNQIGSTGSWVGPFSHAGPFGYQSDGDIPFQQVGHRWLDPTTGRFLTRDLISDGRNWYSYGGGFGAPVGFYDPDGLFARELFTAEVWAEGLTTSGHALRDTLGLGDGRDHSGRPGYTGSRISWTIADLALTRGGGSISRRTTVASTRAFAQANRIEPSWTTIRRHYWRQHSDTGVAPTRRVLVKNRKTGRELEVRETKELHHIRPRRDGGNNDFSNLQQVWPSDHEKLDPYRRVGYDVIEILGY